MATETPQSTPNRGVRGMASRANPAFAAAVVAIPILALVYALTMGTIQTLIYVHVMAGILWTGIDVFMGAVLGPVIGGMDVDGKAAFFERFTPKMTFTMPVLAMVTIAAGIQLALLRGLFPNADPYLALFSTVVTVPAFVLIAWQFDALTDARALGIIGVAVVAHAAWLVATLPELGTTNPIILLVLGIVTLLSIQGFGLILPAEVRIYRQMTSTTPDKELIGRLGMRNAKLGGLQGLMQLGLIALMVLLRWS